MKRRENITFRVLRTPKEVERAEREFLDKLKPAERIELTWRLSQEQWGWKDSMSPDFLDIIRALSDGEARFIIVDAYGVNLYVDPRATGDLDIWVEPSAENAGKVLQALRNFGAPVADVSEADFSRPGTTFQIGISPLRIDILTEISGVSFNDAWADRSVHPFGYSWPLSWANVL